ncbi:hypothetical protein CVT24_011224 [Panaeolus cyanescens]|uniref:Uncharacterized protein n=1 Tax=Panaeolus cyanescens TaxID=181874 RepID=A0A409YGF4_9AGAR|nr:hypothetical protein CVT24_011224 [Panaeolus cyanescens]
MDDQPEIEFRHFPSVKVIIHLVDINKDLSSHAAIAGTNVAYLPFWNKTCKPLQRAPLIPHPCIYIDNADVTAEDTDNADLAFEISFTGFMKVTLTNGNVIRMSKRGTGTIPKLTEDKKTRTSLFVDNNPGILIDAVNETIEFFCPGVLICTDSQELDLMMSSPNTSQVTETGKPESAPTTTGSLHPPSRHLDQQHEHVRLQLADSNSPFQGHLILDDVELTLSYHNRALCTIAVHGKASPSIESPLVICGRSETSGQDSPTLLDVMRKNQQTNMDRGLKRRRDSGEASVVSDNVSGWAALGVKKIRKMEGADSDADEDSEHLTELWNDGDHDAGSGADSEDVASTNDSQGYLAFLILQVKSYAEQHLLGAVSVTATNNFLKML